jgi:undecaprenyl phosphate-alpha-L-ara4N flippase subunit ArnF
MADPVELDPSVRHRGFLFAIASVVLVSAAQLLMKWAMTDFTITTEMLVDPLAILDRLSLLHVVLPLGMGIMCYGVSVLCWMGALARLPLSLAYPLLSLSYPLVYLGALLLPFLHETLNLQRMMAIMLIMLGVMLLMVESKAVSR